MAENKTIVTEKIISNIVDELSKEDIFEKVDKREVSEFCISRIDKIQYDVTIEQLTKRIRKIMAVEAMSKIFDGDPEGLKLFEEGMRMNK